MIKAARAHELIDEHAQMRKEALRRALPEVDQLFREAEDSLRACKTAAEVAHFHPALHLHFVNR